MEILFTHDDLDGAGCRVIFELTHSNEVKGVDYDVFNCSIKELDTIVLNYFHTSKFDKKFDTITFADICPSVELLTKLRNEGYDVLIFDHHPTNEFAWDIIRDRAVILPEINGRPESGTSLLYQHIGICTNKLVKKFVDTIRSYDTWEWKSTNNIMAKKLNTLFFLLGMDKFCDFYVRYLNQYFNTLELTEPELIIEEHMAFVDARLDQEEKVINDFIANGKVYDINVLNYRCAFILGPKGANMSELSNLYLINHPEYDMVCTYMPYDNTLSFRCNREDLDLGKDICAPLGGGGHKKSAGAPLLDSDIDKILDVFRDVMKRVIPTKEEIDKIGLRPSSESKSNNECISECLDTIKDGGIRE